MKIIQSLWTKPLLLDVQRGKVSGGWPSWDHYWASWVLSAWQGHLTHGTVDLVTDRVGAQILIEELQLPFRHVSLALDDIPREVHPALWAYGKVVAYDEHAKCGDPYMHIDSDVYLWKPLPTRVTNAAIAAQHYEWAPQYPPFHDIYNRPRKTMRALMKHLPGAWTPHAEDDHAINMGIFGGNDLDTIAEYCHQVRAFVEHPDNEPGWKLIADSGVANVGWSNMLIEQQTAYCVARQRGVPMAMLFEKGDMDEIDSVGNDLGYTHVMGYKKKPATDEFIQRFERRARDNYPDAWSRIQAGFSLTGTRRTPTPSRPQSSIARQGLNVLRHAGHAATSVAKTSLGIDRATDEQVEARLNVCRQCPGDHAIWRNGDVHTCGPMLASVREAGEGTCGCVLRKKARDLAEDCPFGWWPEASLCEDDSTG
jgi:hypothetical protein